MWMRGHSGCGTLQDLANCSLIHSAGPLREISLYSLGPHTYYLLYAEVFIGGAISLHSPIIGSSTAMLNDGNDLYVASLCVAASLVMVWKLRRTRNRARLPPGPKGLPILGNVLDFPKDVPLWQTFTSLARKHGMYLFPSGFPRYLTEWSIRRHGCTISEVVDNRRGCPE